MATKQTNKRMDLDLKTLNKVGEVAAALCVSDSTIRRWIRAGYLPVLKMGPAKTASTMIARDDVYTCLETLRRFGRMADHRPQVPPEPPKP